ncbi:hypothetical protein BDW60DRAFT_218629 [Aspergillus nidulans var. acristatus]
MKSSLLATAVITPLVSAHYFFDALVIDGQETTPNQYVCSNTPAREGLFTFASQTDTAEVKAGSKLAMKLGVPSTRAMGTGSRSTRDKDRIEFTIPAGLLGGEHLIRSDKKSDERSLEGVHGAHDGQGEFYYEWPQVKVADGCNKDDPLSNFSVWGGMKDYMMSGLAVWTGSSDWQLGL